MVNRTESNLSERSLSALGFDPNAVLAKEPGVLLDPHFLGALHAELHEELGAVEAQLTLMQIGFLQGLHDAERVTRQAFDRRRDDPETLVGTPLAIAYRADQEPEFPGALRIEGSWPERSEAAARLSAATSPSHPSCHVSMGYTSGWLSGLLEADVLAIERRCSATGAPDCSFVAREAEVWRASGDSEAATLLDALPFDEFRALVDRSAGGPERAAPGALERDAAIVHIWGPVMILPFASAEQALRAVEVIGRDPSASQVSVVVLDLSDAIIDEAFDADALEQLVDSVEGWGAETIFAEVSQLSEAAVADLSHPPLLVLKDLDEAIATAFQIATSGTSVV